MFHSKCNQESGLLELMMSYASNEIAMSEVNVTMKEHIPRGKHNETFHVE